MAIGFTYIEFVKRISGKNTCTKSAYNSRAKIALAGNNIQDPATYGWSHKISLAYHEIVLPPHVNPRFKSPSLLWNLVEQKENKINSVPASELVLSLLDKKGITLEHTIHVARIFIQHRFVTPSLAAQIDIHDPEPLLLNRDHKELGLQQGIRVEILEPSPIHISFASETKGSSPLTPENSPAISKKSTTDTLTFCSPSENLMKTAKNSKIIKPKTLCHRS